MKVSLVTRDISSGAVSALLALHQARFFRRRGDVVRVYLADPTGTTPEDVAELVTVVRLADLISGRDAHFRLSDLFVYHYCGHYSLLESIRGIERGLVIFCHHALASPPPSADDTAREAYARDLEGLGLVHYADLCVADSIEERDQLAQRHGYAADRVYVLSPPAGGRDAAAEQAEAGQTGARAADLLRYEADFAVIVDQAVARTLPPMPVAPQGSFASVRHEEVTELDDHDIVQQQWRLEAALQEAKADADVAIHGYVVRSRFPLAGPFIAWTRRNLTSHLREPYVDPIIARQVAFNESLVRWAERAMYFWRIQRSEDVAHLNERIDELEAELQELRRRLCDRNQGDGQGE